MKGIVPNKALRANNKIVLNFSASNININNGIIITISQTDFSLLSVLLNRLILFNDKSFMIIIFFF